MLRVLICSLVACVIFGKEYDYDVAVYTGNGAGCVAAVNAASQGAKVVLIEPSKLLGGMTGGGIDRVDWGNVLAVGSQASHILGRQMNNRQYREFFQDLIEKNENVTLINDYRVIGEDLEARASLGKKYGSLLQDR